MISNKFQQKKLTQSKFDTVSLVLMQPFEELSKRLFPSYLAPRHLCPHINYFVFNSSSEVKRSRLSLKTLLRVHPRNSSLGGCSLVTLDARILYRQTWSQVLHVPLMLCMQRFKKTKFPVFFMFLIRVHCYAYRKIPMGRNNSR